MMNIRRSDNAVKWHTRVDLFFAHFILEYISLQAMAFNLSSSVQCF